VKSRRHNTQVGEERDENGKDLPALRIAVDGTEVLPHGKGILKNGNTNMCSIHGSLSTNEPLIVKLFCAK